MKERPIIFKSEMVGAILDGRKTQTRRIIKPQLPDNPTSVGGKKWGKVDGEFHYCGVKCPYGKPGDRLWVRETFKPVRFEGKPIVGIHYVSDGDNFLWKVQPHSMYAFPKGKGTPDKEWPEGFCYGKSPSIHMPRWASRITLEIVKVRVERINDISSKEAANEMGYILGEKCPHFILDYWEKLHPGSWDRNDWVWVVEFKRIKQ